MIEDFKKLSTTEKSLVILLIMAGIVLLGPYLNLFSSHQYADESVVIERPNRERSTPRSETESDGLEEIEAILGNTP